MRPIRPHRRRASAYAIVLGASTVVAVVGFAALLLTRIERRAVGASEDAIRADALAASALELAVYLTSYDGDWRTTYTDDEWATPRMLSGGSFSFKLVDEGDGDLADEPGDPVRVHAQATVGRATRIYSVEATATGAEAKSNVVVNGDIEAGVAPWTGQGQCTLEMDTAAPGPHGGAAFLWVKNRDLVTAGPRQDIAAGLTDETAYDMTVWLRMEDAPEAVTVFIWLYTDLGNVPLPVTSGTVGTSWTKLTATFTPNWSGNLGAAWLRIWSQSSMQEFMVDDVMITEAGSAEPALIPVAGTWRREVVAAP